MIRVHDIAPGPVDAGRVSSNMGSSAARTPPDTERPYRPLLVVSPEDQLPENRAIGIALRIDTPADVRPLIEGDRSFLLLIDTYNDSLFELIVLCLMSRNYIRTGEAPVLAFSSTPPANLIHRLQQQGWPDIQQWNIRPSHWLRTAQQIPGIADNLLHSSGGGTMDYIFIERSDLEEQLHQHCQSLLADNPDLQNFLTEKHQLGKSIQALKSENKVLQERLHNAETTIGIIRNKYKDDYDILFNWYQQEYEVLPLWYKRFGHLIKVLTGKRTPKSLYHAFLRRLHRRINVKKGKT